jgi:hypothetical protein
MDKLTDFINDSYARYIQQDLLSNFFKYTKHLHFTFQFIINISQINNTINTGQLTAIQCVMQ